VDASGIPGWDKVGKLANALLALDSHVTNKQAGEIKQLYLNLDEYDKKPLMFSPRYKKAKGRFLKKKKTGHVGTEAMARYVKWKTKLTIFILGRRLVSAAVWMEKSCL
jgi:hypothetical protein